MWVLVAFGNGVLVSLWARLSYYGWVYFIFVILDNILYSKLRGVCEGPILASLFFGNNIL